jgi:DNA mismatch endonuclease (patch repair protein)
MSKIRQKSTDIERIVARELRVKGYRFRRNVKGIDGTPDIVFSKDNLVVFVDGDFWHGYRYRRWRHKIQPFWRAKIEANRRRDSKNIRRLRRAGWRVVRLWQHELKEDVEACIRRITKLLPESI